MRVLTFQGLAVVTRLKCDMYTAHPRFSRTQKDYVADKEQLGGHTPIWCYAPTVVTDDVIVVGGEFKTADFRSGKLIEEFRCDMALCPEELESLYLLELEISDKNIKSGTHPGVRPDTIMIPYILPHQVRAIYQIAYYRGHYAVVMVRDVLATSVLFPVGLTCENPNELYTPQVPARHHTAQDALPTEAFPTSPLDRQAAAEIAESAEGYIERFAHLGAQLNALIQEMQDQFPGAGYYLDNTELHLMSGPSHTPQGEPLQNNSLCSVTTPYLTGGAW